MPICGIWRNAQRDAARDAVARDAARYMGIHIQLDIVAYSRIHRDIRQQDIAGYKKMGLKYR